MGVLVGVLENIKIVNTSIMKTVTCVAVILVSCSACTGQPIIKQIANFLSGFKYVPPQTGIFASSSSPSPSYAGVPDNYRSDDQGPGAVVFTTDGWLHPAGSSYHYQLGQEAVSFSEAEYWCREQGGHLAEIYSQEEMDIVKDLLQRDSKSNFWLGLESPREKWYTSRQQLGYSNWAQSEPNGYFNERCTILWNKRDFAWADWNCGNKRDRQTEFKALCQKEDVEETTERKIIKAAEVSKSQSDDQCSVENVSLRGEDWLGRVEQLKSSDDCHQHCLDTQLCQFWTWREGSHICYLRATDGPVTRDSLAVSGTTSASRGCRHSLGSKQARVEHCSCISVSHSVIGGYIDPRSLPDKEEGSGNYEEDSNLGRLIIQSACPSGKILSCTDDDVHKENEVEIIEAKAPAYEPKSNITDCLVNDVRLSVGGLISKVLNVKNSATCHAHCLATDGCAYWTWRGDTLDKKCFLLPSEGRTIRRHGAASGTVLRNLGCDHKIIHQVVQVAETREETGCYCKKEYQEDLVSSGIIDPRNLPFEADTDTEPPKLGRIVSFGVQEKKCALGYKKVCGGEQQSNGPKLFDSGLPKLFNSGLPSSLPQFQGIVRERLISARDNANDINQADNEDSAISFPKVK